MKQTVKLILKGISRIVYWMYRLAYWIIPEELRNRKKKSKTKLEKILDKNLAEETLLNFEKHIKRSVLFKGDVSQIREYAIKSSLLNDKNKEYYYLEFGVYRGESANFFSKYLNKLYAFDSFEGLKEDWSGNSLPKGDFNQNKQIPKLNPNVEPVVGWVEDTLQDFLKKHNPKINFVHLDTDTYSPAKFTLEKIKPHLVKGSIILFDELYNYIGWESGEYKALKEVFKDDEFEYKAFTIDSCRCAIQIK